MESEDFRQTLIDLGYEDDLDWLDRSDKIQYFEIKKLIITECGVLQSIKDINFVAELTMLEVMSFVFTDWLDLLRLPNPHQGLIEFMNKYCQLKTETSKSDLPQEYLLGIDNLQVKHQAGDGEHEYKYLCKPYEINHLIDFMKAFQMDSNFK